MLLLLAAAALAADPVERDAHTVMLGAGALPACAAEVGASPCEAVTALRAHGDHRLGRKLLVAWDTIGVRRSWWSGLDEVAATWRLDGAVGVGAHWEDAWGDMRLWAGPSVELAVAEGDGGAGLGVAWLDAARGEGRVDEVVDVGLAIGNDLDWPLGPVRLGGRWRYRIGADVAPRDPAARAVTKGVDLWELHALGVTWPRTSPVGLLAEVGWTTEITIPLQDPKVRVAPWLQLGVELRAGRTGR